MILYIASPYSHPDPRVEEARYQSVMLETARLINEGHYVYSPIVYAHEMAKAHAMPTDAAWWQSHNEAFIRKCDKVVVLMLSGWLVSAGVQSEIAFANSIGVPVVYLAPGETMEVAA